jgi:hypothetical protein
LGKYLAGGLVSLGIALGAFRLPCYGDWNVGCDGGSGRGFTGGLLVLIYLMA